MIFKISKNWKNILVEALSLSVIIIVFSWIALKQPYFFRKTIPLLRFDDMKLNLRNFLFPHPIPKNCVLVAIDTLSINKLGRWPWDRKIMAKIIDNLFKKGASVIALDITFSEPSNPESDAALNKAFCLASANYALVTGLMPQPSSNRLSEDDLCVLEDSELINFLEADVNTIPFLERWTMEKFSAYTCNVYSIPRLESLDVTIPEIAFCEDDSAVPHGALFTKPDPDGILRGYFPIVNVYTFIIPSLGWKAAELYLYKKYATNLIPIFILKSNHKLSDSNLLVGVKYTDIKNPKRSITYPFQGVVIPTFDKDFRSISAIKVYNDQISTNEVKGKLVFIGATEKGIGDLRAFPTSPSAPGVYAHMIMAENLIRRAWLLEYAYIDVLFVIIFAFLGWSIAKLSVFLEFSAFTSKLLKFFFALTPIASAIFLMQHNHIFVHESFSFLAYITATITADFLSMSATEKMLREAFSNYISKELLEIVVKNPEKLSLGGEKREVSILFSDIRSFTNISESLDPSQLVKFLNLYFEPMTSIILANQGFLDKYIGDAIMAIFGAPLPYDNHAWWACKSAFEMLSKLEEVNHIMDEYSLPHVKIGIGINTGVAVVGNIGSQNRFDYTVIGDTVNLASRLEGLCKQYGTTNVISEFTVSAIDEELLKESQFTFRLLDKVRVKGKILPVMIYELLEKSEENMEIINKFEDALKYYWDEKFDHALKIFSQLAEKGDKPSQVFASRCEFFIKNGIEENWDGVFTFRTK